MNKKNLAIIKFLSLRGALCLALTIFWLANCMAQSATDANPASASLIPRQVTASDDPADPAGSTLTVKWQAPLEKATPDGWQLVGYQLMVGPKGQELAGVETLSVKDTEGVISDLKVGQEYQVAVAGLYAPDEAQWYAPGEKPEEAAEGLVEARVYRSALSPAVIPLGNWYDPGKTNVLAGTLLYTLIVILAFILVRHRDMYIRPIAGLEAVDDAIGRATEMGRPMLFVTGISTLGDVATIASVLVLGHLARRTAAYETPIIVPCMDPMVMAAEREVMREAYLETGRPQSFRPDNIFFVTDSQFGYVAAVDGIMIREKPAANFLMGSFAAESLILAETGNASGAIQVAGTDSDSQIPFFITACDYTLIGEELYAAGAYLSRHPSLMAQLKGQDVGKAIILILIVLTALIVTFCHVFGYPEVQAMVLSWFATS